MNLSPTKDSSGHPFKGPAPAVCQKIVFSPICPIHFGSRFFHPQPDQAARAPITIHEGMQGLELVVRFISTVGNYDYVFDWVFTQNGEIVYRAGATGIITYPLKKVIA